MQNKNAIEAAILNRVLDRDWTLNRRGPLSFQRNSFLCPIANRDGDRRFRAFRSLRNPQVYKQRGVQEVPYSNFWRTFIARFGTVTGQVQREAVSRMWRKHEVGEERGMPDQYFGLLSFLTLWHEWLCRCWAVAATPLVSRIEGVSAKAFTEGLHCDVLSLFNFALGVYASSRTGQVSAERQLPRLPKLFTEGFHCGDCGASTHVSETHVVIDCEGGLIVKTWIATSFNTSCWEPLALTSHDGVNSRNDEIVCGMSCCWPEIHHPHRHPPSLLGFVPWYDDPHFGNCLRGFSRTAIACTLVACQIADR